VQGDKIVKCAICGKYMLVEYGKSNKKCNVYIREICDTCKKIIKNNAGLIKKVLEEE